MNAYLTVLLLLCAIFVQHTTTNADQIESSSQDNNNPEINTPIQVSKLIPTLSNNFI
jgi:hypothetical protein